MKWTAVLPLKKGASRKSRLSDTLSDEQRTALSNHMASHVLSVLRVSPDIARIIILSPDSFTHDVEWIRDEGRGLNVELAAVRASLSDNAMLVIHADLPLVSVDDVTALIMAAGEGVSIAPDRHGMGTNGLACACGAAVTFAFGPGSCALHRVSAADQAVLVRRRGLALDIDTAEDLNCAIKAGFRLPW